MGRLWWDIKGGSLVEWKKQLASTPIPPPTLYFYTCSTGTWLCNAARDRITLLGAHFGVDDTAINVDLGVSSIAWQ